MHFKPLLYNGFKINDSLEVTNRIDRVLFTEIYKLSDDNFLYLFLNLSRNNTIDREDKFNIVDFAIDGKDYIGSIEKNYNIERVEYIRSNLTNKTGFDNVAGMQKLKSIFYDDLIFPLRNPEKYTKMGVSIPNGILLYGPPGCGKTFIVKKLAEEIGYNLIELNPSSIATPYVHGAVSNIKKIFEKAKSVAPSIVFIDEIEGLLPKREDLSSSADIKKEEINEFLVQLNDAGKENVLVIGATNRPQMIDLAVLRSGRMDKRIYINPPDFEARKEILKLTLSNKPIDEDIEFDILANLLDGYSSSDLELIVNQTARNCIKLDKNCINQEMIVESIKKTKSSLSAEEIEYYDQFSHIERF